MTGAPQSWPKIHLYAWTDADGDLRLSFDKVKGAEQLSIPAPHSVEALLELGARTRGAIRQATGMEPREGERALRLELAERAAEARRQRGISSRRPWQEPTRAADDGRSVRAILSGLPTLGAGHR
jgi:hypothetical protein